MRSARRTTAWMRWSRLMRAMASSASPSATSSVVGRSVPVATVGTASTAVISTVRRPLPSDAMTSLAAVLVPRNPTAWSPPTRSPGVNSLILPAVAAHILRWPGRSAVSAATSATPPGPGKISTERIASGLCPAARTSGEASGPARHHTRMSPSSWAATKCTDPAISRALQTSGCRPAASRSLTRGPSGLRVTRSSTSALKSSSMMTAAGDGHTTGSTALVVSGSPSGRAADEPPARHGVSQLRPTAAALANAAARSRLPTSRAWNSSCAARPAYEPSLPYEARRTMRPRSRPAGPPSAVAASSAAVVPTAARHSGSSSSKSPRLPALAAWAKTLRRA